MSLQDEKEKETKPSKTSQAADSAKKAGPETCGIGCVIASQLFVYGSSTLQLDGHPRSSRASVATLEGLGFRLRVTRGWISISRMTDAAGLGEVARKQRTRFPFWPTPENATRIQLLSPKP